MTNLLIIKTGTTVDHVREHRGDFEQWILEGMGQPDLRTQVASVYLGEPLPAARDVDAVIITGSAALVTDHADWSEATARWVADAASNTRILILGICYGHQLLAHALGGEVTDNPRGRQIGTTDVIPTPAAANDPILGNTSEALHIPVSHMQSVRRLPDGSRLLAATAGDPNHAFAIGDRIWGMQCHPEFDADIVRGYIDARRDAIASEGLDPDGLRAAARDTPDGDMLLTRFASLLEK